MARLPQTLRSLAVICTALLLVLGSVAPGLHALSHHEAHELVSAICSLGCQDHHAESDHGQEHHADECPSHADGEERLSDEDHEAEGECALCVMAAQDCALELDAPSATFAARAQHAFPAPQAAPRAGPRGLAPARAPPAARAC